MPGILRGTRHGKFGRLGKIIIIEIVADDQRVVAAEFQHGPLVARPFGNHLADGDTPGKGYEIDIGIRDHLRSDGLRQAGDDREHLGRQSGLVEYVGKAKRGKGCQLCLLADKAVVRRDGRCNLVGNHVEGMIEGRDRRDRPQGLAQGEDLASLALGRQVT